MDILTLILAMKLSGGGGGAVSELLNSGKLNQIMVMGENGIYWEDMATQEDLATLLVEHAMLPVWVDENWHVLVDGDEAILVQERCE